jgi:membrane associated rhomboid family serine protease
MIDDTKPSEPQSDPRVSGLMLIGAMVAVMWVVEVVNTVDDDSLSRHFGIRPRHTDGLDGIVLSPFMHGSWGHLIGNTIPFAVLGGLIALSGLIRVAQVTALVALMGGAAVWLVAGGNENHIGASGVVFGYAGYLVARGVFNRNLVHLAIGVLVAVLFGGSLLSGLIPKFGVSWQGHLFGALAGVVAARILSPTRQEKPAADAAADPLAAYR